MKFLKRLFRKFNRKRSARITALLWAVRNGKWKAEQARVEAELKARPYPEHLLVHIEMKKEEYEALPLWNTLPKDALQTCEFGFCFRMKDGIVCEVVKGTDMFVHQWGSGMSVPERGARYYRARQ